MAKQESKAANCADNSHNKVKETLDFLLHSYRAKLAVDNPSENCPFDFTEFLDNWKDKYGDWNELKDVMTRDLQPLANEGLFDSILPYLAASLNQSKGNREQIRKASTSNNANANSSSTAFSSHFSKDLASSPVISAELTPLNPSTSESSASGSAVTAGGSRSSTFGKKSDGSENLGEFDPEIVIHVCDEAKSLKKDFYCVQSILLKEMGYFSKVTVKGQRLRDMDISVHCDISVFEWLMKWVKSRNGGYEQPPNLDPVTVIGLMVSADFLQMANLVSECLQYTADNMSQIINQSPNLGCLNESLTNRILHFFDNFELETRINHIDKTDRITSRLYTQFIIALNDAEPDEKLGHFSSTATLFRCNLCGQLLINIVASKVPCCTVKSDCRGRIYACHVRDPNWTLCQFVRDLKKELKLWKRVYWRLWSLVHFFCCSQCQQYFAAKDFSSCKFHPAPPAASIVLVSHASPSDHLEDIASSRRDQQHQQHLGRVSSARRNIQLKKENDVNDRDTSADTIVCPHGVYPCCDKPSYQFSPFPSSTGCSYRDHTVSHYADDDPALKLIYSFREHIVVPPPVMEKAPMDWASLIDFTPQKLPSTTLSATALCQRAAVTSNELANRRRLLLNMESSSTDSNSLSDNDNEELYPKTDETILLNQRYGTLSDYWSWNPEYTTRYNQDMQREREEKLMADLEILLAQRVAIDSSSSSGFPTSIRLGYLGYSSRRTQKNHGGSFLKLEERWKEEIQQSGSKSAKHGQKFSKS